MRAGMYDSDGKFLTRHTRVRGVSLPNGHIVYVGRPTKWGNPWVLTKPFKMADRIKVVRSHEIDLLWTWLDPEEARRAGHHCGYTLAELQKSLRGRDLACWCAQTVPCHADTLMRYANLPAGFTENTSRPYFEEKLVALQEAARIARIDPRTLTHQERLL